MRARAHTVVLLSCCHKCHTFAHSTLKVNHLRPHLTNNHIPSVQKAKTTACFQQNKGHFHLNDGLFSLKRRLVFIKIWDISIKTRPTTFCQVTKIFVPCCDTCDSKKHKTLVIRARVCAKQTHHFNATSSL